MIIAILGTVGFFALVWWHMKPWRGAVYREPWGAKRERLHHDSVASKTVYIAKEP